MSREFHRRLKRIGTVRSTCRPGNSRGGAGKGCARRNSASASSSSAFAPDERAMRLLLVIFGEIDLGLRVLQFQASL